MPTPGLRRVARTTILMLAVLVIGVGAVYGPTFYRESQGQPLAYLWGVVKLELTGAGLVDVDPDSTVLIQKCCPQPLSQPLTDFMTARGWTYKDQMGAGIFYEKGSTRLTATSRMFSRRYMVYHLDRTP